VYRNPTNGCPHPPGAMFARWRSPLSVWLAAVLLLGAASCWGLLAQAPALSRFEITRSEEGLLLDVAVRFDLSQAVEEALHKGVPLYFVADASLYHDRRYWRDRRIASASRIWRLSYQPLTRSYRVSFGGLSQSFDNLNEAVTTVSRIGSWKLAEPGLISDNEALYVEFSYKLDTGMLPRAMQIGIGGQPDWNLLIEKTQRVNGP
jgi:hypothetical protein